MFFHDQKHEYMLMMQEDPQRVPSGNSKSPSEEESKYMLGGHEEKDESPNLQSPNFPFSTDERWDGVRK